MPRRSSTAIRRLTQAGDALAELAIGGTAVGTGINTHAEFPQRMAEQLSHDTGLDFRPASNCFEAMANRDAAVEVSGALKTVAISLSNIANNIRWLASGPRCGIGEIKIPELQPGSSIMPGKVNPVIPEAVMMVGAQVVGNDATIAWANALGSNFDLNVMMPVIAYNLLQSIDLLASAARSTWRTSASTPRSTWAARRSRASSDRGRRGSLPDLIELSLAMCTALAPRIGYDVAASMAKRAYKDGTNVRQVALEQVAGKSIEEVTHGQTSGLTEPAGRSWPSYGVPSADRDRVVAGTPRADDPGDRGGRERRRLRITYLRPGDRSDEPRGDRWATSRYRDGMIEIGDPTEESTRTDRRAGRRSPVVIQYRERGVPWMLDSRRC